MEKEGKMAAYGRFEGKHQKIKPTKAAQFSRNMNDA